MRLAQILPSAAWCASLAHAGSYYGYESSASFEVNGYKANEWMKIIEQDTYISALSIPGTHNTMTYNLTDPVYQCQNLDLSTQLEAGIRYLDIRGRSVGGDLYIYHGNVSTGFMFRDVLNDVFRFLGDHPSEVIIMRIKEEGPRINTEIRFEDALIHDIAEPSPLYRLAGKLLRIRDDGDYSPMPTLKEVRGQVMILQDFQTVAGPEKYGNEWAGHEMELQDRWQVEDVDHLEDKWQAVEETLEKAASFQTSGNDKLRVSHLSASSGVLPIVAAAGPIRRQNANGTAIEGMNDRTAKWLNLNPSPRVGKTGIVVADFPGKELISAIISRNEYIIDPE
ncbi:1-phosphatidylinositol phosphodiesterase [Geosmithia morbida]|uniref:1-phosphatidylinositol phosphodiesterase n=1 Tax=Geosmithia morbida TaxID=1094350 RepID=A0A9P4YUR7_9HYPO|nr:1-phosphatidylinositol phosphodiesterase [Geosmithia morbida]KAF4122154.1 1-phosphatidylinositol phosphodiesterase [Geosmithia morbida]